jgi:hypothetical protein
VLTIIEKETVFATACLWLCHDNHNCFYGMVGSAIIRLGGCMDYTNGKSVYLKKNPVKIEANLAQVALKDVPLEVRKKEAKKPLFLTRYE